METQFVGGLDAEKQLEEDADKRNFDGDVLGGFFGYTPEHIHERIETLGVKNQRQVNSCVLQGTSLQKEIDEGMELSAGSLGAYCKSKGLLGEGGMSIQAALKATLDFGIAEEKVCPTQNTTFAEFTNPVQLNQATLYNAGGHKSESYWSTRSLDTILQNIDMGKIVQTGLYWYPSYSNPKNFILELPKQKEASFGHDVDVIGYNLDYNGEKVIEFQNSYGEEWGDEGLFYVRFADYFKIINFSGYFVLDIPKDRARWLSLNAGKVIAPLDAKDPRRYAIVGNQKRHIQNMAILFMLHYVPTDIVVDTDNILPTLEEGVQLTLADIPEIEQKAWREAIRHSGSPALLADFKQVFNDL